MRIVERDRIDIPSPCIDWLRREHPNEFTVLQHIKQQNTTGFPQSSELKIKEKLNFIFNKRSKQIVMDRLVELFDNKCAYCEQSFALIDIKPQIDNYRPKSGLTNSNNGKHYPLHYRWLSKSWENLYLCCPTCNNSKSNHFPIAGEPCQLLDEGELLHIEEPLLLDPCDTRLNISEHFKFNVDGTISPMSERGEITMKLLNLNRDALVLNRKNYTAQIVESLQSDFPRDSVESLKVRCNFQFTELTNQFVNAWLDPGHKRELDYVERTSKATDLDMRMFSPKITEICFKNIGPFGSEKKITINTELDDSWLMILGDNGSGKSTLLKLISLLLIGEKQARDILERNNMDFSSFLKSGCDNGFISLTFSKGFPERHLEISRQGVNFKIDGGDSTFILNSYGAARLTPTVKNPAQHRATTYFVDTLFDSFEPMSNVQETLIKLSDEEFIYAGESLACLFGLQNKFSLCKSGSSNEVLFKFASRCVQYQDLSDGFKAVSTLFCDILSTARQFKFERGEDFNGIILIDELGNHLHPRWRMQIVTELRRLFTNAQFICTTHEPLCLKGLKTGEVVVLRREGNSSVKLIKELPPIEGLTSEQLLTSVHFGLNSTIDPEVENMFHCYYELIDLRERKKINDDDAKKLKVLESRIANTGALSGVFGGTRRDQLIYHAIDKMIAKNRNIDIADLIDNETIENELSALWRLA